VALTSTRGHCPIHNNEPKQNMKIQKTNSNIVITLVAAAAALFFAGCAEMGAGNTTSLLSAAGFRARTPQTPQQQQIYAALPPYQVERATVKGKGVFYVYKDEKAGLAYVGREQEYQHYQQLAIQQQIAQERYMAAQMQADAAWQWYGAWGPRGLWW
jgi:serine phosphatase RsbU (regulator of sigma subunit)